MPIEKFNACREDKITASSSSSDAEDHESLSADKKQELEAITLTCDAGLSSVMLQF